MRRVGTGAILQLGIKELRSVWHDKALLLSILNPAAANRDESHADARAGLPQILRLAVDAVLDIPILDGQWDQLEPQSRGRAISVASCAGSAWTCCASS